jgi:hypothetical protein
MEELATVLAYRAEQLKHGNHENVDMEDSTITQQQNQGEDTAESPSARKKARRVYSGKNKNAEPPMGPSAIDGGAGGSGVLALCLSSRRNMCIYERVMQESDREAVDAACRSMTARWVIEAAKKKSRIHGNMCVL